jgi:hypothetical protein
MATTQVLADETLLTEIEHCLCGQLRCLGHERKDGKIYVPGFTAQEALDACPEEIVIFDHPLKPHVHAAIAASQS